MAGGVSVADGKACGAFRAAYCVARQFFPGGRRFGAAVLLRVAADKHSATEFSCAGGVRGLGVHGSWRQNRELADRAVFSYAVGVTPRQQPGVLSNSHFSFLLLGPLADLSIGSKHQ